MNIPQVQIILSDRCFAGTNDRVFTVVKIVNSIEWAVDQQLTPAMVKDLIGDGVKVTITK